MDQEERHLHLHYSVLDLCFLLLFEFRIGIYARRHVAIVGRLMSTKLTASELVDGEDGKPPLGWWRLAF
jgi:hypothetical protein